MTNLICPRENQTATKNKDHVLFIQQKKTKTKKEKSEKSEKFKKFEKSWKMLYLWQLQAIGCQLCAGKHQRHGFISRRSLQCFGVQGRCRNETKEQSFLFSFLFLFSFFTETVCIFSAFFFFFCCFLFSVLTFLFCFWFFSFIYIFILACYFTDFTQFTHT